MPWFCRSSHSDKLSYASLSIRVLSSRFVLNLLLPGIALMALADIAIAQYQWKDENGRMVFSDQGPPSHIDPSRVVRTVPGRGIPITSPVAGSSAANSRAGDLQSTPGSTPKAGGRETLADRELDAKRKAKEKADAERKKREEAEQTAKLDRACDEMRAELRTLESGVRAVTVNEQGEREFVTDADRERRLDRIRRDIKDSCKSG